MKNTPALTVTLAGLAMVGPFATDTYLPAFPDLMRSFAVSAPAVQQSLSLYLFAYALMTLFYGTLSDSFGRRPVILTSVGIFLMASLGAALAPNYVLFLVFRAIQGLSAGAGMVVGQAIVRDRFSGPAAQKMIANIMMVFGIAPAIAPVIGGYFSVSFGWRSVFFFLTAFAALLWLLSFKVIAESLDRDARQRFQASTILRNYKSAAGHAGFMFGCLAFGFAFSGFALYISSAANFVLQILHLTQMSFGWLFVPLIGGIVLGSAISSALAHRYAMGSLVRVGIAIMVGGALLNILCSAIGPVTVPWVVLPLFVYSTGLALAMPGMSVSTLGLFPATRGLAASLQNFVQMLIFALISGFIAPLLFGSALHLALGCGVGVALSVICWRFHTRLCPANARGVSQPAPRA
ncbi:MAG: multidrug effflux MFS transporter [Janthinobacterium lividum]